MYKDYSLSLDIQKTVFPPIVIFHQDDLNTAKLIVTVLDNGQAFDLTGSSVQISIKKPDRTVVYQDCTVTDETHGIIDVVLSTNSLSAIGVANCELYIRNGDQTLVTPRFRYEVKEALLQGTELESSNEYQTLNGLIIDTQTAIDNANTAVVNIDTKIATKANQSDLNTTNANVAANASQITSNTASLAEKAQKTISYLPYDVIPNIYWISTTGMDTRLTNYINLCKSIGITKVILNIALTWDGVSNFGYKYSIINTVQSTLTANGISIHAIKFAFDKQSTLDSVLNTPANQTALQNKIVSTVQSFGTLDHVVVYNEVPYFYGNSRTVSSNLQMCINTVTQLNNLGYKTVISFQEVTDLLTTDLSLVNLLGGIGINHYPSLSFKKTAITESEAIKGFPNSLRFDSITSAIFNYTGKDQWYLTEIGVMDAWESMQDPVNWELGSQTPSTTSNGQTHYLMMKALLEATKNKSNLLEVSPWWFDSWNGSKMQTLFSQYAYKGGQ